ncbi:hypothetical protein A2911_02605 [Candidatus Nomurabacteria bacterium RIFCSPLOWO2_01_FULL_40_15]|uniref:Capsule synthesis protein CapA domain-containing protein n=1 Tax=Candidatus Nomurabacteria bacterium RIFCSPLOWO2_01_FULL_40_15 TaxID=1801772 RepID=A0A1F6X6C2_9BACT|nr:MAG: hypothetical protein A2911_02605 [Candidatus Nomurabacteria bacterium RIFCSPLOWO2_01_FULL_40_15]
MREWFNFKNKKGVWLMSTILTGIFFVSLSFFVLENAQYREIPQGNESIALALEGLVPEKAPPYHYFAKDEKKKLQVTAGAYSVGDLDTGEIILEKNPDQKFPIASVSKLMTALVLKETANQEDFIQVSKQALLTQGENGNLRLNEKIKISDILYPLLLESSNDAAEAIAINGERDIFIQKMNNRAKDLGLSDTSYEDPSGLSPKNISTANNLFSLAKYIKEKKADLFEITTQKSFKNEAHVWFSNNQFTKTEGYLGGKSGYTDESKQTVVSLFSVPLSPTLGPRHLAITLLKSNDRKKDVENILKYLKQNIYYGLEPEKKEVIAEKEEPKIPEVKEPDFVTMAFAGDIMLDRGVKNSVLKNFDGDYSFLFEKLEILKKFDIVFANLEGTASGEGKDMGNLYSFQMDPSVVPALKGGGISILSIANNHVGDWGRASYEDTLLRLRENEILYAGGGLNEEEAEEPTIIEKYGIKIGFLGFSDKGSDWMRAEKEKSGLLLASNPRFEEIIKNASARVDHLVVSFHFGEEYQKIHNERQEYLAHRAIDSGAKIIIGHHPHVVQDTEVYKGSFIAYSLGNFIFDQGFSKDTMEGMLLEIKLSRDGSILATKNIVKLNKVFQPDSIIKGKEEKIKFE